MPQVTSPNQVRLCSHHVNVHVKILSFMLEPVGSKAPALSSVAEKIWLKKRKGFDAELTCHAQAFPVPSFR